MESAKDNIISNHDFSDGIENWHPNCCEAVVIDGSKYAEEIETESKEKETERFAAVLNRTQRWQGLEQDLTSKLLSNASYNVTALVRVRESTNTTETVLATLRLEYSDASQKFLQIASATVSTKGWEKLQGSFTLDFLPKRVVFYLEGPSAGIDLLIKTVHVIPAIKAQGFASPNITPDQLENIIINPRFELGLHAWSTSSCVASAHTRHVDDSVDEPKTYAIVTSRTDSWQGLEQNITSRLKPNIHYKVQASVCVEGIVPSTQTVLATLRLEDKNNSQNFQCISRTQVSTGKWEELDGTFTLEKLPEKVAFYLEGPPAGFNLLIRSVNVYPGSNIHNAPSKSDENLEPTFVMKERVDSCVRDRDDSIIKNSIFEDGLNHWTGRNCKIVLRDIAKGETLPTGGKHYAVATERTQFWNGIQQDISGRIKHKSAYEVMAIVKISGNVESSQVSATLWVQTPDQREHYISMGRVQASSKEWLQVQGRFLLNPEPAKAVAYLEGPPPGVDLLVASFIIRPAKRLPPSPRPSIENPGYGVNILENSDLSNGLKGWFPLGPCSIAVATGSPLILPPAVQESLGCEGSLSGNYLLTSNRSQTWQGPAQMITDKLKLFLTYQVSAWVRVSSVKGGVQKVNVAISVDSQWNNGGEVEADEHVWKEVAGSFRIEKKPASVMLYVQGPSAGVDLMVAGLQIIPIDRQARFEHLKKQTEKLRTRDVILKITGPKLLRWCLPVKVSQLKNSFPLGSCINRSSLDNDNYTAFFIKHFNWAVFENELKWTWTEPQRGQYNYKDADELLEFCNSHQIKTRGHCIFWEVVYAVQQWVKDLKPSDLRVAIQNRLALLLSRYRGKFQHYDVDNEMMHGSFYQDKLGRAIWPYMFKMAHQFDSSALLFVNDYHVEDGNDANSSPEKYIALISELQEQGAEVGGIGIQGHITYPVGGIVHNALNKLGALGLHIWFTELDVVSSNEHIRADDLEVMLREAFAHPAVEGVMLWGFWELDMSREQAHLVEADGTLNEAGKRFIALQHEWSTNLCGHTDFQGQFCFKAYHGTYRVEVSTFSQVITKEFTIDKGDSPLVIEIQL